MTIIILQIYVHPCFPHFNSLLVTTLNVIVSLSLRIAGCCVMCTAESGCLSHHLMWYRRCCS